VVFQLAGFWIGFFFWLVGFGFSWIVGFPFFWTLDWILVFGLSSGFGFRFQDIGFGFGLSSGFGFC
jgi:hypothetical protein